MIVALPLLAFFTAALSATLGMAGGLLFMGGLTLLLPVGDAMVLHGLVQGLSNGLRAALRWPAVQAAVLLPYLGGALLSGALLWQVRFVPDPAVVFLGLGLLPLGALGLPAHPALRIERPAVAALAGAVVTATQLVAGVGGPLLDVFFVHAGLSREAIVATKAATQVLAHGLKIAWFLALAAPLPQVPLLAACLIATIAGTALGSHLLGLLAESTWRRATRLALGAMGLFYLGRGILTL